MSKYNYDPNLFYERQLLDPHYDESYKSRSYTHWTLCNPSGESDIGKPIISGIISDPTVSVSIGHSFSSPSGIVGGIIGTVNSVANQVTEVIQSGSAMTEGMSAVIDTIGLANILSGYFNESDNVEIKGSGSKGLVDTISSILNKVIGTTQDFTNNLTNSTIVNCMDYVRVYKGTVIQPSVPTLQTRLYHGICMTNDHNKSVSKEDRTVLGQLGILLDNFVGNPIAISNNGNLVDTLLGLQKAPNEFKPDFHGLDNERNAPGTFVLVYGDVTYRNLLVTGFNFTLSTINTPDSNLVRKGDTNNNKNYYTGRTTKGQYLYADVSIQVEPCKYIDRKALKDILRIRKSESDYKSILQ